MNSKPQLLIAEMLGLVCLFEHRLQSLKQSLCGFANFDPKSIFTMYDSSSKGHLTATDFARLITTPETRELRCHFPLFVQRYGVSSKINYEEFLNIILPKNSKAKRDSTLLRSNASIQPFLLRKFQELITIYLIMLAESEKIKIQLAIEMDLNGEDIYELIKDNIRSQQGILQFLRVNGMELDPDRAKYLNNHFNKKNLRLDESDVRNLFVPWTAHRHQKNLSKNYSNQSKEKSWALKTDSFASSLNSEPRHNYLSVKYQQRPRMSQTMGQFVDENQNKQNKQSVVFNDNNQVSVSRSTVQQLGMDSFPVTNPQNKSSTLLQFFQKESAMMASRYQQNMDPVNQRRLQRSRKVENQAVPFTILDRFMDRKSCVKRVDSKSPQMRVRFNDDLSMSLESAFRYY